MGVDPHGVGLLLVEHHPVCEGLRGPAEQEEGRASREGRVCPPRPVPSHAATSDARRRDGENAGAGADASHLMI
ncbi:hypothetical protein GCM10028793_06320 [Nocardiopsis oceani]